jgi:predicted DNA-binding transcriptional regulator
VLEILLKQLGLNEKEIIIFLELQKSKQATPADLAKKTKFNRSTVYAISHNLLRQGLIGEDFGKGQKLLISRPPEDLQVILNKEKKDLLEKQAKVNTIIGELKKMSVGSEYAIPKINFITEDEMENFLYSQSPIWASSILKYDKTWWGFQDHVFAEKYPNWIDDFWKAAPENLQLKLFSNESEVEKKIAKSKKFPRRQIRFNSKLNFTSTTWVNGDHVVLVIIGESPNYIVDIFDKTLAANLRELFTYLWIKEE